MNVRGMSPSEESKPEPPAADPDALAKALEIELILKRAQWQKARSRRGTWLALSVLCLLLVIMGGLVAWFYFASELSHRGESTPRSEAVDSTR